MGLDKTTKTPCKFLYIEFLCFFHKMLCLGGFCFVEYYTRQDAEQSMRYINQTRLDDRIIRTDWDAGFVDGRQYGRGRAGGQVGIIYREIFFQIYFSSYLGT